MNSNIKGGYTFYGQEIGILMMPTVFPRIPGDIGNARTFKNPVRYKLVENVEVLNITESNAKEQLLKPFIQAAQKLEAQGCKAITTSCTFLCGFQRQLADSVHIPVFTSTLILAPMIKTLINQKQKIGILTINSDLMTEDFFQQAGWSSKDISVCISGMQKDSPFYKMIISDQLKGNLASLENSIVELTKQHMETYPDTGAIILECPNYAPFAKKIQEVSNVPVFGINQLIEFIGDCVNPIQY